MKRILILAGVFMMCLIQTVSAQTTDQKTKVLRQQVMRAVNSDKTTDSLYKSLMAVANKSPVITGYIATLQALKAKHHWNPYYKVKHVKEAQKTFDKAIAADPHNMEIRFLRFSVDYKLPGLLGYNKNMETDRNEILTQLAKKNYSLGDKDMVVTIINFLLEANTHTASEHSFLTKQLATIQ
ncbi:MAG: hypothetical protein EOP47_02740 [Sphingobacteriaceae bacterium]|nr:MAG: hypothetical protein EOP47_02740 [Sphingobacteriaceae bacterium]